MLPSAASYVRDLTAAIDTFDRPAVARIGEELVAAVSGRGLTLTAREAAGDDFDLTAFHDDFMSRGAPPVPWIGRRLLDDPAWMPFSASLEARRAR